MNENIAENGHIVSDWIRKKQQHTMSSLEENFNLRNMPEIRWTLHDIVWMYNCFIHLKYDTEKKTRKIIDIENCDRPKIMRLLHKSIWFARETMAMVRMERQCSNVDDKYKKKRAAWLTEWKRSSDKIQQQQKWNNTMHSWSVKWKKRDRT